MCCILRLAKTKASVVTALADDFDTPRAISAVMDLVYHGNCQLQPVSKVSLCCMRSSMKGQLCPGGCSFH